jgi:hypothetical protein
VEPDTTPAATSAGRTGVIGTLVAVWWAIDGLVLLTVIVLAAWLNPLLVFAVALVVCFAINLACCNWIDRHWDRWMANAGKKLERKLEKMRTGRLMRHPVAWIERGSDFWFGLAAALTNAITTVAVGRLIGGHAIGERRIVVASFSFALFVAGLGVLLGLALGDVIRAI